MDIIDKNDIDSFLIRESVNVLICSSSFEKRCFAVVEQIKKAIFEELLVFRVPDLDHRIMMNSELFESKITSKKLKFIDLKIYDIASSFFPFKEKLECLFKGGSKNIVIDITTFTHEGLLILFRFIYELKRENDKVFFIYNGASEYSCNESNNEEKWLTKGVKDVRNIIGYPGETDISKVNHLIILFGFETERTRRLIETLDYEYFSLAYGSKGRSVANKHQVLNEERHRNLMSQFPHKVVNKFEISLTDPITTKLEILDYVNRYSDQRIVIAPMNNKISTLGAGLAAIENKNIQLQYLQPNTYNFDGYSEAGDDFYLWKMP